MYKCPHCKKAYCHSLWRRLVWPTQRPITCRHCGGESRLADKSLLIEALLAQVAAIPLLIVFFLVPWWAALLFAAVAIAGLALLMGAIFPLVPLEPFGSPADIRRAAIHFWVAAPIGIAVVVMVCIALIRALANAA